MKFKFNILSQRLFLLFLVIAAASWYVNKLGYNYRSEIKVPITITVDNNAIGWVENPSMDIYCLVDAKGSEILQYKLGMASPIEISITSLSLSNVEDIDDDYVYSISEASLKEAVALSQGSLHVLQILDTIQWLKVSPMEEARIPIRNNVTVNCEKQFMLVGQVRIQPSTVSVRAAWSVMDTLKYIDTEPITLVNQHKSVSGSVSLKVPRGVMLAQKQVRYSADITGYTELEYNLPVEMRNNPDSLTLLCLPSKVSVIVRVPLRSFTTDEIASPTAYIDYGDRLSLRSSRFRVNIANLPVDGEVSAVIPQFVEPFFKTK